MSDREFIAVFHYDNGGTNRCGAEPYRYAEEIVRCKECKWLRYCETEDLDLYLDCDKPDGGGIPRNEEWFCADGERSRR